MELKFWCLKCKEFFYTEKFRVDNIKSGCKKRGVAECVKCGQETTKFLTRGERNAVKYGESDQV